MPMSLPIAAASLKLTYELNNLIEVGNVADEEVIPDTTSNSDESLENEEAKWAEISDNSDEN